MHQHMEEQRNRLNVKSVEWCERAGGCCSNIRYPIASIKSLVARSVAQYLKTSQYLANLCKKQSWYWTMFLPVFDVNIVTNSYCYSVSGIYVNIHKGDHHFRCKGCNRHCSSQKSLSIHQATIHRVYKKKKKQLLTCHVCGKTLHLEIH